MSQEGTITFVPSVHFSPTHCRRVRETIQEVEPDLVAVELDERRFDRLEANTRLDFEELAAEQPPATAATYAALQALQRTVVRLHGLDPETTDMEVAIETAAELDTRIALIDEPVEEILRALAVRVGVETIPKLLLRASSFGPGEDGQTRTTIAREPIQRPSFEEIESGDDVEPTIDRMRELLPGVVEVMIDRRDRAMAERLHKLRREGYDVVAVIGAGHHNGIVRTLEELAARDADPAVTVPIRRSAWDVTSIPIN